MSKQPKRDDGVVPVGQRYYWTRAWQENERVAVEELARGEGRQFANPRDAVQWLERADEGRALP